MPIHCGTPQKRFQAPTKKEKSEKNSRQTAGPLKIMKEGVRAARKPTWNVSIGACFILGQIFLLASLSSVLVFCGKVCWCLTGMREAEHHQRPVEVQAFKGGAGGEAPRAPA